jgi:hypothetical protein
VRNVKTETADPSEVIVTQEHDCKNLIATLRAMQTMNEELYKKALKRLWLQWHPDKCRKPYATKMFLICTRHSEILLNGSKDFSFLDSIDPFSCDMASSIPDSKPKFSQEFQSYRSQFEREFTATGNAERARKQDKRKASYVPSSESFHRRDSNSYNPLIPNLQMAEIYATKAGDDAAAAQKS